MNKACKSHFGNFLDTSPCKGAKAQHMRILQAVLAVVLVLTLGTVGAFAQEPVTLRYANFPPPNTIPSVQMEHWAKEVQERTQGAVRIQTFPGGTLLDARSMPRGVARGQADIGCISVPYYPGSYPLFELFGLPLGFTSAKEAGYVLWEVFKAHTPKELARYKVLGMFASAPSQIMSTKPVRTMSDLNNLVLRASGTLSDALEVLGGNAVSIPMSETPEALQKGVVEGVFSSWDTLKDLNYAESCRYGLTTNMAVYPFVVIMNRDSWDELPQNVQDVLTDYADEHVMYTGDMVDTAGKNALEWAKTEHGFEVASLDEQSTKAMLQATKPLIEAWKERAKDKGLDPEAILKDVERFREAFKGMQ